MDSLTNYLTINEAAKRLSVSVNTVRSLLTDLGAVDVLRGRGKKRMIRIPEDSILAYLRGCEIPKPVSLADLRKLTGGEQQPFRLERRRA